MGTDIRVCLSSDQIDRLNKFQFNELSSRTASDLTEEYQTTSDLRAIRQSHNIRSYKPIRHLSRLDRQYSEASSPPDAVIRGLSIGVVPLDKKSWLEVRDPKHRYGKRLRLFYDEWSKIGKPMNSFFTWLEENQCDVPGCTRAELDRDTVQYLSSDAEREQYLVKFIGDRTLVKCSTSDPLTPTDQDIIFVLRDNQLLAAPKKTSPPRFHHSSFFGGECVEAAGMFVCNSDGKLEIIFPHSGHYRPCDGHLYTLLKFLDGAEINLSLIQIDGQRTFHTARQESIKGSKVPKLQSSLLLKGDYMLAFLSHKRKMWAAQVFGDIRKSYKTKFLKHFESSASSTCDVSEDVNVCEEVKGEENHNPEGFGWGNGFLWKLLKLHNIIA